MVAELSFEVERSVHAVCLRQSMHTARRRLHVDGRLTDVLSADRPTELRLLCMSVARQRQSLLLSTSFSLRYSKPHAASFWLTSSSKYHRSSHISTPSSDPSHWRIAAALVQLFQQHSRHYRANKCTHVIREKRRRKIYCN